MSSVLRPILEFFPWWRRELSACVPSWLAAPLGGERPRLVAVPDGDGFALHEERARRIVRLDSEMGPLRAEEVARFAAARPRHRLGLRVPAASCHIRTVTLPAAASAEFGRILALDLEQATPFTARDVYAAQYATTRPSLDGRVQVRHVLVKRSILDRMLGKLSAAGAEVSFADCWDETETRGAPVDFLAPAEQDQSRRRVLTPVRALAAAVVALSVMAGWSLLDRHWSALSHLESRVAVARKNAEAVRGRIAQLDAAADQLSKLASLKNDRYTAVEVIEELTRLLPDGAWLTELRLDGTSLDVAGYAVSGSELLARFTGSSVFRDARFTGPLRFESAEQRERFSIRIGIGRPAREASGRKTGGRG